MGKAETDARKQVRDFLRLNGWFVPYFLQRLGAYPGISDLLAVGDGGVLFIEMKSPEGFDKNGRKKRAGVQSENQIKFEFDVESHGGEYFVVRSVEDIAEIIGVRLR